MNSLRAFFISICLLALMAPAKAHAKALAPQAMERLEAVAAAAESDIDLAATLILISEQWQPSRDVEAMRAALDRLTDSVRKKLPADAGAEETARVLGRAIHEEAGYRYTDRVDDEGIPLDPAELFLHGLIASKRGYCMNLSLLYLIVGERLGLPLFGVALPNHFFVRYESPRGRINIEATEGGAAYGDDFYRRRFGVPPGDGFFLSNLSKRQTLGAYFSNVGMVYYKNREAKNAIFYLELATRINTRSLEAHNNIGNIYAEENRPGDAIRHYRLALEAQADHVPTLYNLGLAYRQAGEPGRAAEAFLEITALDPGFVPAHQSLANLYMEEGRPYGALLHLKRLARLDPGNLEVEIATATVYFKLEQAALAGEILTRLMKTHPGNPRVTEALAEARYREGRYDDAIHLYRNLLEGEPGNLKAYVQLGWTYYRNGQMLEAIAWTRRGLNVAQEPQNMVPLAEMNLGLYHVLSERWEEAKSWYQKALAHPEPGLAAAILADLDEAASENPERAETDFFKGWVSAHTGREEKARALFGRYLAKRPAGPLADEARRLLAEPAAPSANGGVTAISTTANESMGTIPAGHFFMGANGGVTANPATANESMVTIPAGHFFMGANGRGADEIPEHQVYVDAFEIDRYEVSAAQFAEFLNDVNNVKGYYLDNMYGVLFYDGRFHPRPGLETLPINNVNWYGAQAYCQWEGKRLPSEAEWEKAARGTDRRMYPWGSERPNEKQARFNQTWTEELKHRVMLPVDSLPEGRSPFGAHHMAGNVKEWVDDWYDREYYGDPSMNTNPTGPIGGEFKVVRGGSWRDLAGYIYSSFRNNSYPETRLDDYGFRCAKSLGPNGDSDQKPGQEARAGALTTAEGS